MPKHILQVNQPMLETPTFIVIFERVIGVCSS